MKRLLPVLVLAAALPAHAAPPADAFAYGVELEPLSTQAFHRYPLPASVLRMMTTRELGDLCVYDASGEPRAHALLWPEPVLAPPSEQPLSVFPLEITRDTSGMEVKIERDPQGQILRTLSQPLRDSEQRAYLLDAHAQSGAVRGLTLTLANVPANRMLEVRVEHSTDLTAFTPLTQATLVQLAHEGASLTRDFIALPSTEPGYLRVSFAPGPDAITLEKAIARVAQPAAAQALDSLTLTPRVGESAPKAAQEFRYLVPHGLRAQRYSVLLPEGTQLIQASLYGAHAEDAPLLALDRQIYRTPASAYPLGESRARVLSLRVDDVGGGIHAGAPTLRIEYLAPALLFAGDGKPPFTLAYGSAEARCTPLSGDALKLEAPTTASVRALTTHPLGGPPKLTHDDGAKALRVYGLWAVLLLAVAALGVIARRLLRKV